MVRSGPRDTGSGQRQTKIGRGDDLTKVVSLVDSWHGPGTRRLGKEMESWPLRDGAWTCCRPKTTRSRREQHAPRPEATTRVEMWSRSRVA